MSPILLGAVANLLIEGIDIVAPLGDGCRCTVWRAERGPQALVVKCFKREAVTKHSSLPTYEYTCGVHAEAGMDRPEVEGLAAAYIAAQNGASRTSTNW
ncbi:MAG TPA: hypothetical protein VMR74_03120 [Gammaproteobacteria bacterium]|nr:hypothetical protein [Gammaproteobacteria bacterium]